MRFRPVFLLLSLGLSFPLLAHAASSRTCMVVGVSDGDTLTARCGRIGSYEQVKVRIAAIDAPDMQVLSKNSTSEAFAMRTESSVFYFL